MPTDFNVREWLRACVIVGTIQFLLYVAYWTTDEEMYMYLAAFPGYQLLALLPGELQGELARFLGLVVNFLIVSPLMVGFLRVRNSRMALSARRSNRPD